MTAGSRGDVAPFTGLGAGLVRAGYEVTLATHGPFAPLVAGSGVRFATLPGDPRAVMQSLEGRGLHESRSGAGKLLKAAALARDVATEMTPLLVDAARDADVVLAGGAVAPLGYAIAEGLSRPSMGLFLQPLHGTWEFPPPMLAGHRSLGPVGNRWSGNAVAAAIDTVFARAARTLAPEFGLPSTRLAAARRARERQRWPVWHGFSERVVPRPRDWRPGLNICGYWWTHDTSRQLPPELEDFLQAGPPPAYVGLGSATTPDPRRTSAHIVAALRAAGLRGVIQRGWAGLDATKKDVAQEDVVAEDMITVGDVPHSALFPRTAVVVHHAGAGTTGSALRAGVPCVPVPVQFDAFFWASRLVGLGTAPASVPLRHLTAATLGDALRRATTDPAYRARARHIADQLAREDGVAPVASALERMR
ncbi:glycosyltransferase [Streptomyces cremeus]|uniref:Glycosyltransferase n=1 Tax=Streptomyces cremeus TaxID=66881 RepID=A0ABV5PE23_STRCM